MNVLFRATSSLWQVLQLLPLVHVLGSLASALAPVAALASGASSQASVLVLVSVLVPARKSAPVELSR
jgi:hypothetical protein